MDPNAITYFAETDAKNRKIKFGIKAKDRLKHMYVIGKTGMGKSTLLENLAIQDIQNGNGMAFIDPHGGTAEKLLDYVPEERIKDVLYFAPFDMEYPISFNVMEDVGRDKRHLVVNGLMSTFEKIWADAWSARMSYILQYAIIGLLEYPGSTLLGINKMLSDKEYRKKVVDNITDASAKSFWIDEFGKYTERFAAEATPAIQNKVGQFTSNPLVRNIIGQSTSSFDVRKMMDEKKIMIINLSKGRVGEGNANLLGSMLITKIYLAAMSRADLTEEQISKLPNFYLYVDEFQSFANKSFADILSEARKYKLNLTIAHQYIEQMEEEVRNAVFGNVGTMVTFRVGAFDAEVLEKEFAPVFTAEDLVNLGFTQIYLKLMIDGVSSAPFSATTIAPIKRPDITFKNDVIESSRNIYSRKRDEVEAEIIKFYQPEKSEIPQNSKQKNFNSQNGEQRQSGGTNVFNKPQEKIEEKNGLKNLLDQTLSSKPVNETKPLEVKKEEVISSQQNIVLPNIPPKPDLPKQDTIKKEENNPVDKNKQAFLEAQRELLKLQQQFGENKEAVRDEPKILDLDVKVEDKNKPVFENKNEQKKESISLYELKNNHEKNKIPTNENLTSLKSALSSVLSKEKEGSVKDQENKNNVISPKNNQNLNSNKENTNSPKKEMNQQSSGFSGLEKDEKVSNLKKEVLEKNIKEVPEDVLRKLLSMDE